MSVNKDLDIVLDGLFPSGIVGPELVVNGDFSTPGAGGAETTSVFDSWLNSAWSLGDTEVAEVDEGQLHGGTSGATEACNLWSNSGSLVSLQQFLVLVIGERYLVEFDLMIGTGTIAFTDRNLGSIETYTTSGHKSLMITPTTTGFGFKRESGALDATIDNVSIRKLNTAWLPDSTDWDLSNGNATHTSTSSTDSTLSQPTVKLVEGRTYTFNATVSTVNIQDPAGGYAVQLGASVSQMVTQAGTYEFKMVCGASAELGLEVSSVNTTAGDTFTIDDASIPVEQFVDSTNLDSVFVTGDIFNLAGLQVLSNNTFTSFTGVDPNKVPTSWVDLGGAPRDATNKVTDASPGMRIESVFQSIGVGISELTVGKEYSVKLAYSVKNSGAIVKNGTFTVLAAGVDSGTFVATATTLTIESDPSSGGYDDTISSIEVYELTTGPIDEYVADLVTDYGDGAGNGLNGEIVYKSVNTHADGTGGTDYWFIASTGTQLRVTVGYPLNFSLTSKAVWKTTSNTLIATFDPDASSLAVGLMPVTYGPSDHSVQPGNPGLETDGLTGYVDLNTSWDFLNNMRAGKFGIISVFTYAGDKANARVLSAGTSASEVVDQGNGNLFWFWSASGSDASRLPVIVPDIINTSVSSYDAAMFYLDVSESSTVASDNYSGLNAVDSVRLVLASSLAGANTSEGKYGFTAILDFSAVTTVDATWSTNLSIAINAAAVASNYDPHAIAAAMTAYINGIDAGAANFVYYACNEAIPSNSVYLGAYDQDGVAKSSEFYGLTSVSGVTSTQLVVDDAGGGGYRGDAYRNRYQGLYRPRYA